MLCEIHDTRGPTREAAAHPEARRVPNLKRLATLFAFVIACMPARGDAQGGPGMFWTGGDLHAACTGGNSDDRRLCAGYVMAIVDVLAQARNERTPVRACVPFNIAQQQAIDVTLRHMQGNAELRRDLASAVVMAALTAAYPCP